MVAPLIPARIVSRSNQSENISGQRTDILPQDAATLVEVMGGGTPGLLVIDDINETQETLRPNGGEMPTIFPRSPEAEA